MSAIMKNSIQQDSLEEKRSHKTPRRVRALHVYISEETQPVLGLPPQDVTQQNGLWSLVVCSPRTATILLSGYLL